MRDFETDFDFGEGLVCNRTRDLRDGDDYYTLSGFQPTTVGIEQVFTPEREARVQAHCKRVQAELKRRRR